MAPTTTIGAAVNSAHKDFAMLITEVGAAGSVYAECAVYYRLIG